MPWAMVHDKPQSQSSNQKGISKVKDFKNELITEPAKCNLPSPSKRGPERGLWIVVNGEISVEIRLWEKCRKVHTEPHPPHRSRTTRRSNSGRAAPAPRQHSQHRSGSLWPCHRTHCRLPTLRLLHWAMLEERKVTTARHPHPNPTHEDIVQKFSLPSFGEQNGRSSSGPDDSERQSSRHSTSAPRCYDKSSEIHHKRNLPDGHRHRVVGHILLPPVTVSNILLHFYNSSKEKRNKTDYEKKTSREIIHGNPWVIHDNPWNIDY